MTLRFSIGGNRFRFTFKFLVLTALLVALFAYLGFWQLARAEQKRILVSAYQQRPHEAPIPFAQLFDPQADVRYYSIQLKGHFDNQHQIVLDNKTQDMQVGYEIYTPFIPEGSKQAVLIDRGFIPAAADRSLLPTIKSSSALITLKGVVNKAPTYFALGEMQEKGQASYPLRVQFIDLKSISSLLGYSLAPYVIWLDAASPLGFDRQWKVSYMGPEKHTMYAVQWFAFAGCLLILFVALNIHRDEEKKKCPPNKTLP